MVLSAYLSNEQGLHCQRLCGAEQEVNLGDYIQSAPGQITGLRVWNMIARYIKIAALGRLCLLKILKQRTKGETQANKQENRFLCSPPPPPPVVVSPLLGGWLCLLYLLQPPRNNNQSKGK